MPGPRLWVARTTHPGDGAARRGVDVERAQASRAGRPWAWLLLSALPLAACTGADGGAGAGEPCLRSADCAAGLSCAPEAGVCQPAPGVTGAACAVDADCAPPQFCEVQAPGGSCTRSCTPCPEDCLVEPTTCPAGCIGPDEALCPNGGRCAHVVFGDSGVAVDRCLARCDDDGDCRTGYRCQLAPGSALGLCLP